ncbi:hypothetical protein, partial [uncultured Subdoligranulum sp.]|uniref:hypothetical protein n=1 Tax=uncultured Subdoligranulum sp. TaxID=512298 RepID=UPI00261A3D0B
WIVLFLSSLDYIYLAISWFMVWFFMVWYILSRGSCRGTTAKPTDPMLSVYRSRGLKSVCQTPGLLFCGGSAGPAPSGLEKTDKPLYNEKRPAGPKAGTKGREQE